MANKGGAAPNLNDPAQLSQVLLMLSDSAQIKKGEKLLKPFLKQPQSLMNLFVQMRSADGGYASLLFQTIA